MRNVLAGLGLVALLVCVGCASPQVKEELVDGLTKQEWNALVQIRKGDSVVLYRTSAPSMKIVIPGEVEHTMYVPGPLYVWTFTDSTTGAPIPPPRGMYSLAGQYDNADQRYENQRHSIKIFYKNETISQKTVDGPGVTRVDLIP